MPSKRSRTSNPNPLPSHLPMTRTNIRRKSNRRRVQKHTHSQQPNKSSWWRKALALAGTALSMALPHLFKQLFEHVDVFELVGELVNRLG